VHAKLTQTMTVLHTASSRTGTHGAGLWVTGDGGNPEQVYAGLGWTTERV
jgi:hypothetical protein